MKGRRIGDGLYACGVEAVVVLNDVGSEECVDLVGIIVMPVSHHRGVQQTPFGPSQECLATDVQTLAYLVGIHPAGESSLRMLNGKELGVGCVWILSQEAYQLGVGHRSSVALPCAVQADGEVVYQPIRRFIE